MNLDNVPLDDELMVPQPNLERQSMVIEQQSNESMEPTPMADNGKGQSMEEIAANAFVIMAQQQVVEQYQRQAQVVGKTTNTANCAIINLLPFSSSLPLSMPQVLHFDFSLCACSKNKIDLRYILTGLISILQIPSGPVPSESAGNQDSSCFLPYI